MSWTPFPYDTAGFDFAGARLEKRWARLHRGDLEPFPDADFVSRQLDLDSRASKLADAKEVSQRLCEAWRAFHRGDFEAAARAGDELGPIGAVVANKAAGIYAAHLEQREDRRLDLHLRCAERAEAATEVMPDHTNHHYQLAYALGRYSQGISITKALAKGLGGRVKAALDRTLGMAPDHAEAHLASGLYHAEIIDKVGSMVGSLTYGASKDEAAEHFRTAMRLFPDSPIVRIEHANGLIMMYGRKRLDEATRLYIEAAEIEPQDAMERLDVEMAKAELE